LVTVDDVESAAGSVVVVCPVDPSSFVVGVAFFPEPPPQAATVRPSAAETATIRTVF
jgi:hypothetical protein